MLFHLSDMKTITAKSGQDVTLTVRHSNITILVLEWKRADLGKMSSNCVIRQKPGAERDKGEGQERRGTPRPHTPSLTGCNKVEKIIDEVLLAGFGQSHCSLHSRVANFTKEEQTTM